MGFPNHFGYCRQSASAPAILLTHKCRSRLFMSREKRSAARFAWLDFAWLDGVWPIAKKLRVVYGSWFWARTQAQAPVRVRLRCTVVMHMKIRPRNYSSRTLRPAAALSLHCNSGRAWHPRKKYPSADQITPDQIRPCYVATSSDAPFPSYLYHITGDAKPQATRSLPRVWVSCDSRCLPFIIPSHITCC